MAVDELESAMNLERTPDVRPAGAPDAVTRDGKRRGLGFLWLLVPAIALGAVLYTGIASRARASVALKQATEDAAIPTVAIIQPKQSAPLEEIVLPGNVRAQIDTPIYARTSGYLKKWYVDIGAGVKAGQLLAEIETPEIDQQLQQARADLATADANYQLAQTTASRWQGLVESDSVSKQETDEKVGALAARKAALDSATFNVGRLQQLHAFSRIYAPFGGVITARNTDVGALIDAGANSPGKELFHLASTSKLRVYVNVPQNYSRVAKAGVSADLTLAEFPGRHFTGTLVRTAQAIDAASRTLLVEVEVNNTTGELLPGSYVSVHLKLPSKANALTIPVNTLLFRSEGLRVAVVRDGHAQLVPITVGRDFGQEVEVVAGLNADDSVIVSPADSLTSGAVVRIAAPPAKPAPKAGAAE
jgi:RND family efflux transporter MFP subunit